MSAKANGKILRIPLPAQYGPQSSYQPEFAQMASIACGELGASGHVLGRMFGVGEATIRRWQVKHPAFLEAVKVGRERWDTTEIEGALKKRAKGFRYSVTETERVFVHEVDKRTGKLKVVPGKKVKRKSKYLPPSVQAIELWLTTRNPDRWPGRKLYVRRDENRTLTLRLQVDELKKLPVHERELLLDLHKKLKSVGGKVTETYEQDGGNGGNGDGEDG
jgi:hypothetical protein